MTTPAGTLLANALKTNGVEYVFGMPGSHCILAYDGLFGVSEIKVIQVTDEQNASVMADGYGKVSGRPAVCLVTAGPGGVRLAAGVAGAYQESVPMVVITTEVPHVIQNRSASHDSDLRAVYRPIVKAQVSVSTAGEIPSALDQAFSLAVQGRPRPVQVLVPANVWAESVASYPEAPLGSVSAVLPRPNLRDLNSKLRDAAHVLSRARRPIIYAGCGVINADASQLLREVAAKLSAPVFTSISARGVIPETDPLCFGLLTFQGANDLLREADACLAVGTCFSEISTLTWAIKMPKDLIQVDIDPAELGKNYPVKVALLGDAKHVLNQLVPLLPERRQVTEALQQVQSLKQTWKAEITEFMAKAPHQPLHPRWVVHKLRELMPAETIFVADGTQAQFWLYDEAFTITQPRTLVLSEVYQTMGYCFGAAIGAKLAAPSKPVVCIAGDGTFMMQLGEIATAVANNVPVIVVVLNNGYLNAIRHFQRIHLGERYFAVKLHNPDFVRVAQAFGAQGFRVDHPSQLAPAIHSAMQSGTVTILDVAVDDMPVPRRWMMRSDGGVVVGADRNYAPASHEKPPLP